MSPLDPDDYAEPKNIWEKLDSWWDWQKEGWSMRFEKEKGRVTGFFIKFKKRF